MAFETLDEMNKQTTAPISLRIFEEMCEHKPLQFKYNGTKFEIPLGEDVIHTFEAMVALVADNVADNSKSIDSAYKKVAVDYCKAYVVAHYKGQHTHPDRQPYKRPTEIFFPVKLTNGKIMVIPKVVDK